MQESAEVKPLKGVAEEPTARHSANWAPTGVALLALLAWAAYRPLFGGFYRMPQDIVDVVWGVLIVLLGATAIPALLKLIAPNVTPERRRQIIGVGCLVVAIPLVVALFWYVRDALNPIPSRVEGSLPNLSAMLGKGQHDAERMLGYTIPKGTYGIGDSAPTLELNGTTPARFSIYLLPDLNRLDSRPFKRMELASESSGSPNWLTLLTGSGGKSDAQVVVYYSKSGEAVGARLDVSTIAAQQALSEVTTETVLRSAGLEEAARSVAASQALAAAAASSAPGPTTVSDVATAPDPSTASTGFGNGATGEGEVGGHEVDYFLRLAGMSSYTLGLVAGGGTARDLGDVTVVVSAAPPQPKEPLATASTSETRTTTEWTSSSKTDSTQDYEDRISGQYTRRMPHNDETFWIIICAQASTERAAADEAAQLNSHWVRRTGDDPSPFVVERSGHLQWISDKDYWVVIYDIGYGEEQGAQTQLGMMGFPLAVQGKVTQITKVCGDRTIAAVIR